jgi:Fur family transcriptional regulator, zinc uptake regulator
MACYYITKRICYFITYVPHRLFTCQESFMTTPRHSCLLAASDTDANGMEKLEHFARQTGTRLTPIRRRVLELLGKSATPLSAYEIVAQLKGAGSVAPMQVYRALEFLQEAKVVHRLASKSTYVACTHTHEDQDTLVFMVCNQCGGVQETVSSGFDDALEALAHTNGFKATTPCLEIEGQCLECQERP